MSYPPPQYYPSSSRYPPPSVDNADREYFQQKVYHYLNKLREFLQEVPYDMRPNINEDIIQRLAHVLAEGKVFTTVSELIDSQRIEEQILHKQLVDLRAEQSATRSALRRKHRDEISMNSSRPHHLPVLHRQHEQETQRLSKTQSDAFRSLLLRILDSLDGRVVEQQLALERLGVPTFTRTTDPDTIRIQMKILDWIVRLAHRPLQSFSVASSSTYSTLWPP
ncbi:unnamed protein product [Trichobilharzia szidati]|nr:unnamed protein product [Trichobilharzia szidati]